MAYKQIQMTLKVSTIEQTAEEGKARGGKGNAALIAWDFGKDISVTLEDALFSAKSMAIMFGNGTVLDYSETATQSFSANSKLIMRTETFTATSDVDKGWSSTFNFGSKTYTKVNPKYYDASGAAVAKTALVAGTRYFCTYDVPVTGSVIEVSADSFPGTYYVVGETYARSEDSGNDDFFQFIIPKAKVTSENTIALEAEGDPSVDILLNAEVKAA